ncbi:hypothetical protein CORC01_08579 [Colletotrichum orchidophilum]|uniref:Uncharacterized protein n=1 Tax=Colletotrichum orchidophilum TaxID=1209926 RepID=A0A1G4B4K1_9PEZI|nr:uncharacterized protein CORC01_08579 [Colletotrichum orchidophilum]OHE96202.1 hypothetical protein CORC01_08579 [Colletotrichum orchidophilum]
MAGMSVPFLSRLPWTLKSRRRQPPSFFSSSPSPPPAPGAKRP